MFSYSTESNQQSSGYRKWQDSYFDVTANKFQGKEEEKGDSLGEKRNLRDISKKKKRKIGNTIVFVDAGSADETGKEVITINIRTVVTLGRREGIVNGTPGEW